MRVRNVLFALLILSLTMTVAQAARPTWDNWPDECAADTPVCFYEFGPGTVWTVRVDDEIAGAFSDLPAPLFMREDPDGTMFLHIADNKADLAYVPPGALGDPSKWFWSDPWYSGHVRMIGNVVRTPSGNLSSVCPFEGHINGVVLDWETGQRYKMSAMTVLVTDPGIPGGCREIMNDIKLKPIKD